ncbi:GAF domain-containing protein [uncultured Sphingomonas sp.]|uniref:GAF domain-containing protein n=1 Tax=uncultured Sphingomonas sp. TaxID=158754 RepID=UPI0030F59152
MYRVSVTFYSPAPIPPDEAVRNAAVYASGLLDRMNDPTLNAIAKQAKELLHGDWAGVALIVDDVQIVIASSGGQIGRYERARSMSAHAILSPEQVFCVPDARAAEAFGSNPFVRVGLIRFFVAAPLVNKAGLALGVLCVSSRTPRQAIDDSQANAMRLLASRVFATP